MRLLALALILALLGCTPAEERQAINICKDQVRADLSRSNQNASVRISKVRSVNMGEYFDQNLPEDMDPLVRALLIHPGYSVIGEAKSKDMFGNRVHREWGCATLIDGSRWIIDVEYYTPGSRG